jgi:hypothetical protein
MNGASDVCRRRRPLVGERVLTTLSLAVAEARSQGHAVKVTRFACNRTQRGLGWRRGLYRAGSSRWVIGARADGPLVEHGESVSASFTLAYLSVGEHASATLELGA